MDFGTVETVAENGVDGPPLFVQAGAITSGSHLATILGRLFRVREGLRKLPSFLLKRLIGDQTPAVTPPSALFGASVPPILEVKTHPVQGHPFSVEVRSSQQVQADIAVTSGSDRVIGHYFSRALISKRICCQSYWQASSRRGCWTEPWPGLGETSAHSGPH